MKRLLIGAGLALGLVMVWRAQGQERARTPVRIPDIPGYKTLKCDFHIHTVFSDGSVWPDVRPEEAWREGLDAIAITDHIEYQPHKEDLPTKHNRSHEIAKPRGDDLQVIVIRGSEITRKMPPGHLNAIFLADGRRLEPEEWRDAVKEAHQQGAFIFWNHPGWRGQQEDGVARWYNEQTELLNAGQLHGIEVVNSREYYPEAHAWCLEKNLTLMSNSDIHSPLNLDYDVPEGDHRPLTLVFASAATPEAIKEALFARRTAVYSGKLLIGRREFLLPVFEQSVSLRNPVVTLRPGQRVYVQVTNDADLTYRLSLAEPVAGLTATRELDLPGGKTALLELRRKADDATAGERDLALAYRVTNLLVAPQEALRITLRVKAVLLPKE
jgi:3',5'-nucleoside bisphosphate phosphatase